MNHSVQKGFSFGLTSGIITTLGLLVGLEAGTGSRSVVIGGILAIAIADSMSDALGIHVSEEAEGKHTQKQIWQATFATLGSKLFFTLTFLVPFFLFSLQQAVYFSIGYGLILTGLFSHYIAKKQKVEPWKVITEHVSIAVIVVILTYIVGKWISILF